jgi:alpha,alpha-trehalase
VTPWLLEYEGFDPGTERLREALCTLGNGYVATRGAAPECPAGVWHYPGTYGAGIYNRLETEIAGRTIENEDLVNLPNWLPLGFRAEGGAWFAPEAATILEFRQTLDIRRAVLHRVVRYEEGGRVTRVEQRRLVSMAEPHRAALETSFTAENWSGRIEVRSELDGTVVNSGVERYKALSNRHLELLDAGRVGNEVAWLLVETLRSRVAVAVAARTRVRPGEAESGRTALDDEPGRPGHALVLELAEGRPVTVEKTVALFTSRDQAVSEPQAAALDEVAQSGSFDELLDAHAAAWDRLWNLYFLDLEGRGDERIEMILNLHVLHLLQTVSPNTVGLDVGVPARGLHGEAYRGHVFWDEVFILPFLNLRLPALTRGLLSYRYRRLGAARRLAEEAGFRGAMFPWQSGSDGREETQELHLNPRSGRWLPDHSRLQRHVNVAISFNVWQHYQATGDLDWLSLFGAEMLVEISRFLASMAEHDPEDDRFDIRGVVGPDEYHEAYPWSDRPGLDNNAYTNVMTAWTLTRTLEVLELLGPERRRDLSDELGLTEEEVERWDHIGHRLRVPFHDDGIISQFEGYERLKEFDWEGYRQRYGDIQRLDRILEAEGDSPNRYKLAKQADVLMLLYLLSREELIGLLERMGYPCTSEQLDRNVEYYLKRTSHGSTLSRVVHGWVLARMDPRRAWPFFTEALQSDVADIQGGTTAEGIHLGAMAGTVDLVQRCFSGLEMRGDVLRFSPALPKRISRLRFGIQYRQHYGIGIDVGRDELVVTLPEDAASPIMVGVGEQVVEVGPGSSHRFDLGSGA